MQTRSFRGSGEPVWVIALSSACERLGPDPRRALGPAAIRAAQTGRTHDRTRPMLQQRQKVLAMAPSTREKADIVVRRALEDEMCDFGLDGLSSGRSPDRLDALVWAVSTLTFGVRGEPRVRGCNGFRKPEGALTPYSIWGIQPKSVAGGTSRRCCNVDTLPEYRCAERPARLAPNGCTRQDYSVFSVYGCAL